MGPFVPGGSAPLQGHGGPPARARGRRGGGPRRHGRNDRRRHRYGGRPSGLLGLRAHNPVLGENARVLRPTRDLFLFSHKTQTPLQWENYSDDHLGGGRSRSLMGGIFHFHQRFPEDFGRGGGESEASRERERESFSAGSDHHGGCLGGGEGVPGQGQEIRQADQDLGQGWPAQAGDRERLPLRRRTHVRFSTHTQTNKPTYIHSVADLRVPGRPARDGLRS